MSRQKRFPLLLDTQFPPERQVLATINAVPDGERAGVLRELILIGHQEFEMEQKQRESMAAGKAHHDPKQD